MDLWVLRGKFFGEVGQGAAAHDTVLLKTRPTRHMRGPWGLLQVLLRHLRRRFVDS